MDAISGIASTLPSLSAIGMALTFLRDVLDARGGPILGFIAGLDLGGRWPRLAGGESGGGLVVVIGTVALLAATVMVLAGVKAERSRRRRSGSPSRKTTLTAPSSSLARQPGTVATGAPSTTRFQSAILIQH